MTREKFCFASGGCSALPRVPPGRSAAKLTTRGKTSAGWFYGFKLQLVVNDQGELLAIAARSTSWSTWSQG